MDTQGHVSGIHSYPYRFTERQVKALFVAQFCTADVVVEKDGQLFGLVLDADDRQRLIPIAQLMPEAFS